MIKISIVNQSFRVSFNARIAKIYYYMKVARQLINVVTKNFLNGQHEIYFTSPYLNSPNVDARDLNVHLKGCWNKSRSFKVRSSE